MKNFSFDSIASFYPERIDPYLLDEYKENGLEAVGIDEQTTFGRIGRIGAIRGIGYSCGLGAGVVLGDGVLLGNAVHLGDETILGRHVAISDDFEVEAGEAYFDDGSSVEPLRGKGTHGYLRKIDGPGLIVGPNVRLPSEVQLGENAVIPTSASIGQIGRYGETRRMVTVYGSDEGPRYSVGCQYGIDIHRFKRRVSGSTETTAASAAHYKRHMPDIEALGMEVQEEYNRETSLVVELREKRNDAFIQLDQIDF